MFGQDFQREWGKPSERTMRKLSFAVAALLALGGSAMAQSYNRCGVLCPGQGVMPYQQGGGPYQGYGSPALPYVAPPPITYGRTPYYGQPGDPYGPPSGDDDDDD